MRSGTPQPRLARSPFEAPVPVGTAPQFRARKLERGEHRSNLGHREPRVQGVPEGLPLILGTVRRVGIHQIAQLLERRWPMQILDEETRARASQALHFCKETRWLGDVVDEA